MKPCNNTKNTTNLNSFWVNVPPEKFWTPENPFFAISAQKCTNKVVGQHPMF